MDNYRNISHIAISMKNDAIVINALPEVKEKANDVTSFDYNNDGVIKYLMDYLNID